jgi:hypothetical protein
MNEIRSVGKYSVTRLEQYPHVEFEVTAAFRTRTHTCSKSKPLSYSADGEIGYDIAHSTDASCYEALPQQPEHAR